jgi:hypothetical protein
VPEVRALLNKITGRAEAKKVVVTAAASSSSSSSSCQERNPELMEELKRRSPAEAANQQALAKRRHEIDGMVEIILAHVGESCASPFATMAEYCSLFDKVDGFLESFSDSAAVIGKYKEADGKWPDAQEGALSGAVGVYR